MPGGSPQAGEASGLVTIVIHRRLAEESAEAYRAWQRRLGAVIAAWPGFVDRRVLEPDLPVQADWIIVERFSDADAARAWLRSDDRARLLADIEGMFVGDDDVHLFTEEARHPSEAASVLISSRVPVELEPEFLVWQRAVSAAEARFEGFVGHKVERPVPGVQDDWVVLLSFDSHEHLEAWLGSPQRARLLKEGERFNAQLTLTRANYGFGFWSQGAREQEPIFKNNLLVLLMLYPLVYLWGYFVSAPLIDSHGVPIWLSLFIGNLVSTQLLGWLLVPWAFKRFGWWLKPRQPVRVQLLGYLVIVVLYALSMALYAWLLSF
ncbi:antibiotic biosynthesis monooxygenase [Compostimonas suwonensis]|uniref:ABM domain-containing protein n=1 Tax=Compostimonas suwonensis TaxID=1048394 RepID=A0A2M9C4D9_9MICO|nr:antibiotic biosynthesis monooxygenase [Compostimonas suwonensis]PJJ65386.1 hypothetical protein CLV54_0419 [Compostimonas suwonensis]